jgi:hypothetical protein
MLLVASSANEPLLINMKARSNLFRISLYWAVFLHPACNCRFCSLQRSLACTFGWDTEAGHAWISTLISQKNNTSQKKVQHHNKHAFISKGLLSNSVCHHPIVTGTPNTNNIWPLLSDSRLEDDDQREYFGCRRGEGGSELFCNEDWEVISMTSSVWTVEIFAKQKIFYEVLLQPSSAPSQIIAAPSHPMRWFLLPQRKRRTLTTWRSWH